MSGPGVKCLIIADFNVEIFMGYLSNDGDVPQVSCVSAGFGKVLQPLMEASLECWSQAWDCVVVWTQPENVVPSFRSAVSYHPINVDQVLDEVDAYAHALISLRERVKYAFVPTWVLPSHHRGYGMLEMRNGIGIANLLMRMNLRLAEQLEPAPSISLLPAQRWIELAGPNAFNPKLWYMGKVPFGNEVFKAATKDLKAALRGISGDSKKLIVVDLDDTLWGGIVGEVGWQRLNLGGHDPVGEAFADFQRGLKALTNRGVLLGIVSKNTESVALQAIENHPDMVLNLDDFAGWKINWNDKAENVVALASELTIGLQSVMFIDDNPAERARVKEALPEVLVPDWSENKMMYASALMGLPHFDTPVISHEDRDRRNMYLMEKRRKAAWREVGSLDEWLKTLCVRVKVEQLTEENLQRAVQLLNKTNQMNLSTRRMTDSELVDWVKREHRKLWTFRVSDRFGDSGLTGIISLEVHGHTGRIVDFLLSCRVLGRKIEEAMLFTAASYAESVGLTEIYADYIPTTRNHPCLEFLRRCNCADSQEDNRYRWLIKDRAWVPDGIQLEWDDPRKHAGFGKQVAELHGPL